MRRIALWIGIPLAILILAVLSAPLWISANDFRPLLETDLSKALGREVKLGDLQLAVFSGAVTASQLSVADDPIFSRTPFVSARSLRLSVELLPLIFSHKLTVNGLTIDQPEIVLTQADNGDWNFSKLGSSSQAPPSAAGAGSGKSLDLSVKLVKINGGHFTLGRTGNHQKPLVLDQVNLELRDYSATTAFPFSFSAAVSGGGTIQLTGKAGPLDSSDAAATPVQASLHVGQVNLAGSWLTAATPGVAGLLSFDGNGESHGNLIQATGQVKVEKLKLSAKGTPAARTLELDFAVDHDLRRRSGTIRRADIHIGAAVASLTGTYAQQGESTILKMNLSGPQMPIPELAAMLPALGVVLPAGSSLQGGTASAHFSITGPAESLVTVGSLSFQNTRLTGFNLGQKMSTIEKLAGIQPLPDTEIQTLSADLRADPQGMSAQQIKLVVPSIGELAGGGTVSPANALDFKMSAMVHAGGLAAAISDKPIPFTIQGTAADPVFRPDIKAVAKDEIKGLGQKAAGSLLKGLLGGKK